MTANPFTAVADQIRGQNWIDQAECAPITAELFYVAPGGNTEPAKLICGRCPVARECLEHALTHGEIHGIWGGLSPRERRELPKPRHVDPCSRGHDRNVVGRRADGYCAQCHRERNDRYYQRRRLGLVQPPSRQRGGAA